ncbi:MAG: Leucyl/phenylalanyl-tRNA--protein transferase [Alphaproteobacteria bacterium MarineAlpha5_Bin9]|nr:MAG: Leucyl/phenylalanyl-tRNA--protein transferase [Alphaproteobacteria bacterium MarineAlpha5_Bin9]|tara:strand:+ start:26202 stop:26561 length:360 start_codon:yes stop_codon:yes gene_type:complete
MHKNGYAHSVECWKNSKLVGGLYGLQIGACFFGESMFSNVKNASKLSLVHLIALLNKNKFQILDSQFYNSHLLQFGAFEIFNDEYQNLLKKNVNKNHIFDKKINYSESINILQSLIQIS